MGALNYNALWEEARENNKRLLACTRHRFAGGNRKFGQKHECLACGGRISGPDVLFYIEGYKAAGGKAEDIYPGWGN